MEIKHENKRQLTRNEVLALDVATHTGYFSLHGRGTWDFTESLRRNNNKQHKAFRDTLMEFITENNIRQLVMEDVSAGSSKGGFKSSVKLSEFRGIAFEICDELDLPEPILINPKSVKKWATGNGNATKEDMVRLCRLRWKTDPVDDNEADATHIFFYYIRKFNL